MSNWTNRPDCPLETRLFLFRLEESSQYESIPCDNGTRELARRLLQSQRAFGTASLVCAVGLVGITVLAGMRSARFTDHTGQKSVVQVAVPKAPTDVQILPQPANEPSLAVATPAHSDENRAQEFARQQSQQTEQSQHAAELAQHRQQAQLELDQAAAEYDFAAQQWNAEVAACQQSGPPAGYTPNQMGRLAAMGYRPHMQPQRQPNQALLYAARQAEQRYLQARDNCQRLAQAQ